MSSTFTTNKHLELQGTGDHTDTWGAELNTAVFTLVDQCLGSAVSIALASTPVTLSTVQTQNLAIQYSGVLTANVTVTVPAVGGFFFMQNNTTGNFSVTIASAGAGTSQVLPRGYGSFFVTDGINIYNVGQPLGAFVDIAGGATVDIGTIANGLANVTGSGATITSLGATARPNQSLFYMKFNGVNSIVPGVTLLTPGGGTITTALNDVFLVWYEGSLTYRIIGSLLASGQALVQTSAIAAPTPQTVLSGPATTNGVPTFLPSTSASLVLTAQGLTTTPLVIVASGGYGATGLANTVAVVSSNIAWTCTASNTNYLGYNLDSSTAFVSILAPVYQTGGSVSTTNGQYTFDVTAGKMYVGTGSGTTTLNAVFVGQCVAAGSTITSTVMYAYQGALQSQASTNALHLFAQGYGLWGNGPATATITFGNNLASISQSGAFLSLVFTTPTANANYHVTFEIDNFSGSSNTLGTGVVVSTKSTTGFTVTPGCSAGQLSAINGTNWSCMVFARP